MFLNTWQAVRQTGSFSTEQTPLETDNPSTIAAPSSVATSTRITEANADADGVRNITYYLYQQDGTILAGSNATEVFNGLVARSAYKMKASAETYNPVLGTWTLRTSPLAGLSTAAPPLPGTPASFTRTNDSGSSATDGITKNQSATSWMSVAGATSYEVTSNGTTWTDVGNVTTTTLTGLADGAYTLQVRAKNGAGVSAGASKAISLDSVAPATPVLVSAAPTVQGTQYNGLQISLTDALAKLDSITVGITGGSGGTITGLSVSNNTITFNYLTPNAASETPTIAGADKVGNAFSVTLGTGALNSAPTATDATAASQMAAASLASFLPLLPWDR